MATVETRIVLNPGSVIARITGLVEAKMNAAGNLVRDIAIRKLSVPQPVRRAASGRLYGLAPSAPGESPRTVTRDLRASVTYEVITDRYGITTVVGSSLSYALTLEMGSHRLSQRPWLRPALAEAWNAIQALFQDK